jgi:hypothetical protein
MKYVERIEPVEAEHIVSLTDTELKFILELARAFGQGNTLLKYERSGDEYKPNDKGFVVLAGIVQLEQIVPLSGYDPLTLWSELPEF